MSTETTIEITTLRPVAILLIEDNPGDVALTKKALTKSKLTNNLDVVSDGEEAIAYLRKEGKFASAARPDLILLDLNLPKKSGVEVLEVIKSDEDLKRIPTVILTTSKKEEDILKSYNNSMYAFYLVFDFYGRLDCPVEDAHVHSLAPCQLTVHCLLSYHFV